MRSRNYRGSKGVSPLAFRPLAEKWAPECGLLLTQPAYLHDTGSSVQIYKGFKTGEQ